MQPRCNSEFSAILGGVVHFFGLWIVLTEAGVAAQCSEYSAMYCVQSTTVQHALVSVQNWVHCICVKFSIQTEFQCIALHCVLHCEMKQLVPHQDLMHQFILILMQSSHPLHSPLCQSQLNLLIASDKDLQFSFPFSGEPYGSLSDLYEYDYGEGASENEIGVGKSTPQFLTQPQQLVSHTHNLK